MGIVTNNNKMQPCIDACSKCAQACYNALMHV